ncbi:ketopantoate reductase family protein [Nocardioides dilutus]
MRYVVYGVGAVGGVIAGHLHRTGHDVTLLARGDHLAAIQARGLTLDTYAATYVVDAPATDTAADVAWTDDTVVVVAVKSQHTPVVLADLVRHAPPDTPVLTAQNGVANEAEALRRFARTYGVLVMLPSTHLEPGVVVQKCHPVPGMLDLGRVPGGTDDLCAAVAADLGTAGFGSEVRPDIMAWKHRKLLMNLGNAVDASCAPGTAADELAERAQAEGEETLRTAGIPVVSAEVDEQRRGDALQPRPSGQPPRGGSTWQSLARGADGSEVDYLTGEIVLQGRLHGIPTPVNALLLETVHDLARRGAEPRSVDAAELLAHLK